VAKQQTHTKKPMLKPTPSKPGLFSVAYKQFSCLRGIAVVIFMTLLLSVLYLSFMTPSAAYATTSNTLNFQARLESSSGAIAPDGTYNIEFKLYSASSGGTAEWTEDYTYNSGSGGTDARVHVANGYLTANLGSITTFPTTINWDQQQYLTMNIGGTVGSGTITWDGEMSPRLPLTAVPYAFRAGQLAQYNATTGYTSTLGITQPTGGNQTFVINDQAAAGTYALLTSGSTSGLSGATAGVVLQSGTPGTAQTGSFNVSGTGIAGTALQTPSLDTASAGTLTIGGTNATTVNIATNAIAHTIAIGSGAAAQALTIGSTNTTSSVTIQTGSGALNLNSTTSSTGAITIGNTSAGNVGVTTGSAHTITQTAGATSETIANTGGIVKTSGTFQVQNSSSTFLNVSTSADQVLVGSGATNVGGETLTIENPSTNNWGFINTDGTQSLGDFLNESLGAADIGTRSNTPLGFFTNSNSGDALLLGTNGSATFANYTNSTTAFQIQNAGGATIVDANTNNGGSLTVTANPSQPTQVQESDSHGTNQATTTFTTTPTKGDLELLAVSINSSSSASVQSVSGGDVGLWEKVTSYVSSGSNERTELWEGVVANTFGGNTVTVTYSATPGVTTELTASEFSAISGTSTTNWQVMTTNTADNASSTTVNFPSVTSTGLGGEMYWGYMWAAAHGVAGSTSGFTYHVTGNNNVIAYNPALAASTAYAPTATESTAGTSTGIGAIIYNNVNTALTVNGSSSLNGSLTINTDYVPLILNVNNAADENGIYFNSAGPYSGNAGAELGVAGSAGQITTDTNANDLVLKNGNAGGAIRFNTGGSTVSQFVLNNTGAATFKNSTNSTTAFQVQNTASDQILNLNTVQSSLLTNPDFEGSMGYTNWTGVNSGVLSQNTTSSNVYYGNNSLAIALGATANSGATTSTYTSTLSAGTYSLSFMAKGSATLTGLTASLGSGTCTLNSTTVSTNYNWYYCAGVVTTGSPVVTITTATTSQTLYLDGVELDSGSNPLPFKPGSASIEGSLVVNGNELQAANSQYALTVNVPQNTVAGGGGLVIQGNGNDIFQKDLAVQYSNGSTQLAANTTVSQVTISGGSTFWGTSAASINSIGGNGAQVLSVKNDNATNIIDTTSNTSNLISTPTQIPATGNPATNWTAKGSFSTLNSDSTDPYIGLASMKAAVTAVNNGMQTSSFNSTPLANTQYQLTFYAECSAADSTFTYGRDDVSGTDINATTTATCGTTWQEYTWHFTTGATITNPNIFMDTGSGAPTTMNLWIDAVSLVQTTISTATNYDPGNIYLPGVIAGPVTFQNTTNSTNAFQIQNSSGADILNVNTGAAANGTPGAHLNVDWVSGDTDVSTPTAYFGSSNSSDNQIAIYAQNNGTGSSCSTYAPNVACPAIMGVSVNGNGVRGVSTNQVGVVGTSSNSFGVYGYSNASGAGGVGVFGQSYGGPSGEFQASVNASNTYGTLITEQQGSQTGDLFDAQNSSGTSLLRVTSTGQVGIGSVFNGVLNGQSLDGSTSGPQVQLNVSGAIQQTGMSTPNSGAGSGWTELGYCTITNQYQRCETSINILGGNDGGATNNTQATVTFRVKQQNLMGAAPYINVTLNNTAEIVKVSDFEAITTTNTCSNSPTCSTGNTTVQLWGNIEDTYENWQYTPELNIPNYSMAGVVWTPNNNGTGALTATGSLPAGTVTTAVYGDSVANTLQVQTLGGNTNNSFQVQNSAGSRLINVDTSGSSIMVGGQNPASTVTTTLSTYEWDGSASNDPSLSVTAHTAGDLMLAAFKIPKNGYTITAVTGGGVAAGGWHHVIDEADTSGTQFESLWEGTITTTGATTVAPTYSATPGVTTEIVADEFSAGLGSSTLWAVTASNTNAGTTTTINYPNMTSSQGNQLYWAYDDCGGTASGGATPGFTYKTTAAANEIAYNTSLSADTTYTPTANCGTSPESGVGAIISAYTSNTSLSVTGNTTVTSNSTTAFNVQSTGGSSLFDVDATNNTVTLLQNTQVSTSSAGSCGTNYNLDVTDNLLNPTTSVRWRANGCGDNIEGAGQDLYITGWSNANFTGSQFYYERGDLATGDLFLGNAVQNGTSNPLSNSNGVTLLVLDETALATTTDPTNAFPGSMYYNASMDEFRCYEKSEWVNCVSATRTYVSNVQLSAGSTTSTTYAQIPGSSTMTITKLAANTNLTIHLDTSWRDNSTTTAVLGFVGVNVNGGNTMCTRFYFNLAVLQTHMPVSCTIQVSPGTGTVTIKPMWATNNTAVPLAVDGNDQLSMTVTESY
jgi:hypothetical protein